MKCQKSQTSAKEILSQNGNERDDDISDYSTLKAIECVNKYDESRVFILNSYRCIASSPIATTQSSDISVRFSNSEILFLLTKTK